MSGAPVRAYVGLGGNLGDVPATLAAALAELDREPGLRLVDTSPLYRTPAWGRTDQPDFINAVAAFDSTLSAPQLLACLLDCERRHGRDRSQSERWAPRPLDLDLLLHGAETWDQPGLQVPHPHLHERAFVLVPLAAIAPGLHVPGRGRVGDLLAEVDSSGIEAIP